MADKAILLTQCPNRIGIVAAVANFISENNGKILHLEQHSDPTVGQFFMRTEWALDEFAIPKDKIGDFFGTLVANKFDMKWNLYFSDEIPKMAVFVSLSSHCLYDILQRYESGEWKVHIPLIISNHERFRPIAERFNIPFYVFPITKENKLEQEAREIELLKQHEVDFVVLARYMQVLTDGFIDEFRNRIINIHHSFLPAFIGAKPYHQAHKRGVKIIGATSHYVTAELDAGPIIVQDVTPITHRDDINDLKRKGKNLEKLVLSQGVFLHLERKVWRTGNRTIIFS